MKKQKLQLINRFSRAATILIVIVVTEQRLCRNGLTKGYDNAENASRANSVACYNDSSR